MLYFTTVIIRGFFIDTEGDKSLGDNLVTFIDFLSNLHTFVGKGDIAVGINGNIAFFTKGLHCNGYARLCEVKVMSNINTANITVFVL